MLNQVILIKLFIFIKLFCLMFKPVLINIDAINYQLLLNCLG
jgi:hypothetical protein